MANSTNLDILIAPSDKEYDVTRKDWGYYATPSMNGRLKSFGYMTALVKNSSGMLYIMIVDEDKMDLFESYLDEENQKVVQWFHNENINCRLNYQFENEICHFQKISYFS